MERGRRGQDKMINWQETSDILPTENKENMIQSLEKLFLSHNYWGHCAHGNTQSFTNGVIPFLWSVPHHCVIADIYSSLGIMVCFLSRHPVWIVRPDVCASLNYVQSILFVTGGQSRSRHISRMIKAGCTWPQLGLPQRRVWLLLQMRNFSVWFLTNLLNFL